MTSMYKEKPANHMVYGLETRSPVSKKVVFFEWTIWTQLPETALANQSEPWGNLSLWPRWFWFQFTNLFRKHWFAVRGQSPVNVRESPSMIFSHPLFDGYRFSKFDPCAIHKVPMAWWSSCRCTRKAIHNQILDLMRMATNATSCRDQPEFQLLEKILIWFDFLHSPSFSDCGSGFSSQNMTLSERGGSDMALWHYDMKGPRWTERWSFVFSGSEIGSYLSPQSSPYQCIYRSMRFKKLEPSNLGSAPKNHGNLHVIFSIHVEIPLGLPKAQVAAISCGTAVVSGLSSYGKRHLEICWVRDVMISKSWPGIQIISLYWL